MMEDIRVCVCVREREREREVLAINRFIYASSVQQPNTGLLGSDSEYGAIKSSSGTRLTRTRTMTLSITR